MNRICIVVALVCVSGCASSPPSSSSGTHPTPTQTAKRVFAKPTPTPALGSDDIHLARTRDGRFEATGVLLRTPNFHGSVAVRDVKTSRVVAMWNNPGGVTGLSFSPDGALIAVNSPDRLCVWRWRQKRRIYAHSFDTGGGQFRIQSAFSPNGKQLAVAFGSLVLIDVASWKVRTFSQLPEPAFVDLAVWSPNGRFLALARHDMVAFSLVELRTGGVWSMGGVDAYSEPIFSTDSRFLAGATQEGTCVWKVTNGRRALNAPKLLSNLSGDYKHIITPLAFSKDGRLLACQNQHGAIGIWRSRDAKRLLSPQYTKSALQSLFERAQRDAGVRE